MCCLLVLAACGGGERPAQQGSKPATSETKATQTQPTTGAKVTKASQQGADGLIDACSLLTQAEVEAAVGRPVLAPRKEEAANLSTCSYGDPTLPLVAGRPLPVLTIGVFVGSDAQYYAGAAAQARDSFETGRKNAASVQPVSGLGDDAYWDKIFHSLHVLKGKYEVEVEIKSDAGGLDAARGLAVKVLSRLP